MKIFDSYTVFPEEEHDGLLVQTAQEIPEDYVSWLKKQKLESKMQREGNFMHVAALPAVLVHKYLMEGFDVMREPIRETVKRLHKDGLDAFVVTNKRI